MTHRSAPFIVVAHQRAVQAWSSRRLPFEPRGWLRDLRADIASGVRALEVRDGELLQAVYRSDVRDRCDVENVLFYNVGAGCFAGPAKRGLRFERGFAPPPRPRPLEGDELHYVCYAPAPIAGPFAYRREWRPLATFARVEPGRLTEQTKPAVVWHAAKRADVRVDGEPLAPGQPFGIAATVAVPAGSGARPAAIVKPLLDGLIAALHSHDGTDLATIAPRLAAQLPDTGTDELAAALTDPRAAVLGRRRLLWPRGVGVQWNPGDDACHAVRAVIEPGATSHWQIAARVFALKPREGGELPPVGLNEPDPIASAR